MGRGRKAREVEAPQGRQLNLDGGFTPVEGAARWKRREIVQSPYEERLLRWFTAREEVLRKKK